MATLLLSGTQLEPQAPSVPLNKPFLIALGCVYLLAMHFFMPNPGGAGLALSFNATTWLVLSFALAIGLYQLATYRKLRYSKLTVVFLISSVIMTLPMFYTNAYWQGALSRISGLWAGLLLFVVLQQFYFSNKHKQRLLWYIVLACLIEAAFGLFQYFELKPGNIFGYDTIANRPYGIFQQPNVMASFLASGLVLSGYLLARQPKKYNKHLSEVSLLYLTPVMTLPLLVVLASRTGWLSALLGIALILPYIYRFSPRQRFINWILASIAGLLIGFAALQAGNNGQLAADKADLDSPRRYTFPQALDMLIEKPFTGYGYGNFEAKYILYTARQHQLNSNYHPGLPSMDHPHNETLYWGVEGGLLPILGMAIAAGFVLMRIRSAKKGTRLAMFALLLPITLHSQLEYPFYHSAIHWITFIILLFWIDQRVAKYRFARFSKFSKSALRIASILLPFLTTTYMLSALHTNYVLTKFETSQPRDPEILNKVTNPVVWQDRYDWDVYSTYLNIGLYNQQPQYIQPYIDWSLAIIKHKPRPAFYNNLILAYQGLGDHSRAEQIRTEAEFLFPDKAFANVQYVPPSSAVSAAQSHEESDEE
ncbi:PglL family O-oligosaccharyltransferase [Vibrio fluvialis]|uniref:PglL family O-oligosaccharyltransferase n=1 Tax=Vibrio fluvialis TaxID=676 RepID=UPI001122BC44|nr:PglL family O-oligosaccharyltransferase [Vibrio fluvialis]TOY93285.1 ligase [Vibrio fluvialis]TRN12341.1 ligase [Vibrio fluvialis]